MRLYHLIFREIFYRKLSFCLGVLSASVAVACVVGQRVVLRQYDARTEQIIAAKEAETRATMAALEDDYRKLMLKLGFNVLILPKDQSLSDLYAEDFASKYMPEEYAARLARSRVVTINHVLPALQQKIQWPEHARTVLLMGVRSEVYVQSPQQKPMLEPVAPGTMILGHELAVNLQFKPGDKSRLMGREFTVAKINPARGNKDDITVWINLAEAQEMLNKRGLINGILAPGRSKNSQALTTAIPGTCESARFAVRSQAGMVPPATHVYSNSDSVGSRYFFPVACDNQCV